MFVSYTEKPPQASLVTYVEIHSHPAMITESTRQILARIKSQN